MYAQFYKTTQRILIQYLTNRQNDSRGRFICNKPMAMHSCNGYAPVRGQGRSLVDFKNRTSPWFFTIFLPNHRLLKGRSMCIFISKTMSTLDITYKTDKIKA